MHFSWSISSCRAKFGSKIKSLAQQRKAVTDSSGIDVVHLYTDEYIIHRIRKIFFS